MEIRRIGALGGPNIWARVPVLEVELGPGGQQAVSPTAADALHGLLAGLPPAASAHAPDLSPAGCPSAAHLLKRLTNFLQNLAGSPVGFGLVHGHAGDGAPLVVVEYEEEPLARACLETARQVCLAALQGRPFDLAATAAGLRDLAYDVRLGPSTGSIVRAAARRGVPVRRLSEGSLVQLGHGARQRRILTAETDRTSAIAQAVAQDKQATRALLQGVGVPIPEGRPVADAEDGWAAAEELGLPVVVKPQFGNQGRGVSLRLGTREQVARAYETARAEGGPVVVEQYIPGADHRILVIGGRVVAAAVREPAQVVGDGRATVAELVAAVNRDPRRSDGHATPLSFIRLDALAHAVLAEQGLTAESVPPAGARVLLRRNANLSTGGTATDVTDRVHPDVAARAVQAAQAVGLDIAGVDVVAVDIGRPLEEQRGAVVEVNAGPGLRMHLEPSAGTPRPVGDAIASMLFADGETGRIPVVAVTGRAGTTAARLVAHLAGQGDRCVGLTCGAGTFVNGRPVRLGAEGEAARTRSLLLHPRVEAAVVEATARGILREGLGVDRCDVAVVTALPDADSANGRPRPERVVVEAVTPAGSAVLSAADPHAAALARLCPGSVIFFAPDAEQRVLAEHRAAGGRCVFVRAGSVVFSERGREELLLDLARLPAVDGTESPLPLDSLLAAAAAAWSLGLPLASISSGVTSFALSADGRR